MLQNDSHTNESAVAENPMMDANFTTPCFTEAELSVEIHRMSENEYLT